MCYIPVSSHKVGHVFQSKGKSSEKRSLESKIGMEWTGIGLRPVDVYLQTEEIYCNYSVLIGSPE